MSETFYEVRCPLCGAYFAADTDAPELGEVYCECPDCHVVQEMPIVDEYDMEVDEE